jgi:glutamate-ammonia-ligase adenylyltransferase
VTEAPTDDPLAAGQLADHGTDQARLARLGFSDPGAAAARLASAPDAELLAELLPALAVTADPDAALAGVVALLDAERDGAAAAPGAGAEPVLGAVLRADEPTRDRLLGVLGASAALAEHLRRHPGQWRLLHLADGSRPSAFGLRRALLAAVGADPEAAEPRATEAGSGALDSLRVAYRGALLGLAARDLTGAVSVGDVAAELADLAAATLEAALAVARAGLPGGSPPCRLAVIAMGKCGGHELNYVSDVDVIFVAEAAQGGDAAAEADALRTANALAVTMMRACSATTAEGTIWPVDAALRPEGKAGPLVRTLASHLAYYERWAKTWEFQALLKARPVAGDAELGRRYVEALAPLVWAAAERPDFVTEVQEMRRRVEATLPAAASHRELKLGPGGLRDVEFCVQLLQLVHGRTDERLRSPNTLGASWTALTASCAPWSTGCSCTVSGVRM